MADEQQNQNPLAGLFDFDIDAVQAELQQEVTDAAKEVAAERAERAKDVMKTLIRRVTQNIDAIKTARREANRKAKEFGQLIAEHKAACDAFTNDSNPFPLLAFMDHKSGELNCHASISYLGYTVNSLADTLGIERPKADDDILKP